MTFYPVKFKTRERSLLENYLERTNPIQGLSIREAQNIYDYARCGNYSQLHYLYNEIEAADSSLLVCTDRRASALAGLGWKVACSRAAKDEGLAREQADAARRLVENFENLDETLEHLALAFFRGFSHASIRRAIDGTPFRCDLVKSWNFCHEHATGDWWWNPKCLASLPGAPGMERVPAGELVTVVRPRAIDYPALRIFIRKSLGERDWGRFIERYGIPPVNVVMPQFATEEEKNKFIDAAAGSEDGRTTLWSYGAQVSYAEGARGVNPFESFIRANKEEVFLLATGGTLTSLAQSGSGTLAGGAQWDVWEQIVARDAVLIARAFNLAVVAPYLRSRFPARDICAAFELGRDSEPTAAEAFDLAAKARAAGYTIAREDLEAETGYRLVPLAPDMASPPSVAMNAAKNAARDGSAPDANDDRLAAELEKVYVDAMAEAIAKELGGKVEQAPKGATLSRAKKPLENEDDDYKPLTQEEAKETT